MNADLDSVVDSIVTSNAETPQLLLKSWLDQFYSLSATSGLSSSLLIKMITFVCNSPTLAMTTRLYITETCLIPNDYISQELVDVVISQLGTATAISDSRLQVPEKIQVSLCKWLVQVFFLFSPGDESNVWRSNSSIWIHLWQFDYLQHWLTYIVLWTTTCPKDVKRWKVIVVGKVASKPNYLDSRACSTLILRRFERIAGQSELITRTITDLKCNQRRLKSLQTFQYDREFLNKLRSVLLNQPFSSFTNDILNELISSSLEQVQCLQKNEERCLHFTGASARGTPLLTTQSLNKVASQWDCISEPLNVELFLKNMKTSACHLYLLSLGGEHRFWAIGRKWIKIQLGMVFKNDCKLEDQQIIRNIIKVCQIYYLLLGFVIQEFFTVECFNSNPEVFLLLFTGLFSLPTAFDVDQQKFLRDAMKIAATSFLSRRAKRSVFPLITSTILLFLRNSLAMGDLVWTASSLDLTRKLQEFLASALNNAIEDRPTAIALTTTLKSVLTLQQDTLGKLSLKNVIAPPSIMHRFFISDDPLLLDACCYYLVHTKELLREKDPSNRYVKLQNSYILDLTNFLWRNRMLESKRFVGIPSDFLREVADNLYLPDIVMKVRAPFSITGIPALSYAFIAKLRALESAHHVGVRYTEPLADDSFQAFKRSESFRHWLGGISNIKELKIAVLRALHETGPYNNVAVFLFTYLKSLAQYGTVNESQIYLHETLN